MQSCSWVSPLLYLYRLLWLPQAWTHSPSWPTTSAPFPCAQCPADPTDHFVFLLDLNTWTLPSAMFHAPSIKVVPSEGNQPVLATFLVHWSKNTINNSLQTTLQSPRVHVSMWFGTGSVLPQSRKNTNNRRFDVWKSLPNVCFVC